MSHSARIVPAALIALLLVTGGCATKKYYLSPTPNVVAESGSSPFETLAEVRRTADMKVLYVTDREPEMSRDGEFEGDYSAVPSRQTVFGEAVVTVKDTTWEEFEKACSSPERDRSYVLTPTEVTELGAFPPQSRFDAPDQEAWDEKQARGTEGLRKLIQKRLAETPVKDVYIFVHGYSTKFGRGLSYMSDFWVMMGLEGVPLLFSWPAGSPGILKGYTADWDSGDAASGDLSRLLHLLRDTEGVEKIHLIGYSRGCDVVVDSVLQLALYYNGRDEEEQAKLQLENLVLLAPDVDDHYMEVQFFACGAHLVPKYLTVYTTPEDSLVGLSGWLRGERSRLGTMELHGLGSDAYAGLRRNPHIVLIDAQVSELGSGGHGYWRTSSSCSSDVVLMLRHGKLPGAENGRPMVQEDGEPIWVLRDGYPSNMEEPEKDD